MRPFGTGGCRGFGKIDHPEVLQVFVEKGTPEGHKITIHGKALALTHASHSSLGEGSQAFPITPNKTQ